jgi:hypothetical protein
MMKSSRTIRNIPRTGLVNAIHAIHAGGPQTPVQPTRGVGGGVATLDPINNPPVRKTTIPNPDRILLTITHQRSCMIYSVAGEDLSIFLNLSTERAFRNAASRSRSFGFAVVSSELRNLAEA